MEAHHGKAELFLHCQCCMRGVSFSNLEGSSDFFGDNDSAEIVHSSDNASCFHISFSFSAGYKASLVQREVAARRADGGIVFIDKSQSPSQLR